MVLNIVVSIALQRATEAGQRFANNLTAHNSLGYCQ